MLKPLVWKRPHDPSAEGRHRRKTASHWDETDTSPGSAGQWNDNYCNDKLIC